MRLRIEIDLPSFGEDPAGETGRILRYWAGAVGQLDLTEPIAHDLMDSSYSPVGTIEIVDPAGSTGIVDTGPALDLKAALHRYLRRLRGALIWKLEGLGEADARWPRTPTGTNLLGLLLHVAAVESEYFGVCVGRPFAEPLPFDEDAENADMFAGPDQSVASVRAFAERVWEHCDAVIDALPLDAPAHVPWWGEQAQTTLGHLLVHVVAELGRHAGHADIVRELTDGASGLAASASNLPDRDERWWADYVRRLQEIATDAATADEDVTDQR